MSGPWSCCVYSLHMYQGDVKRWQPRRGCFSLLRFCPRIGLTSPIRPRWAPGGSPRPECGTPQAEEGPGPQFSSLGGSSFCLAGCECQGAAFFPCTLRREAGVARMPPPAADSRRLGMALDGHREGLGVLILVRVPDAILTQPFGRRAAHGETGWTRMLLLVPGEKKAVLSGRNSLLTSVL